jgi:hypothetical protein
MSTVAFRKGGFVCLSKMVVFFALPRGVLLSLPASLLILRK